MQTPRPSYWLALLGAAYLHCAAPAQAQVGKDGPYGVGSPNTVVNKYTALTANAGAGAETLTVASTADLSAGDLVMVIQMQGASINNSNTANYGSVTDLNNAGNVELAVVQRVASPTSVVLSQPLTKSFSSAGKTQVVRVPRFSLLHVNAGASVAPAAWNGTTGGVLAVEAQTEIRVNGTITATGRGFRGGAFSNTTATNNANFVGTGNTGGQKGEGIAGYEANYPGGSRGRGAAANGGGGGNSVNAGGGGGANGGNPAAWTGRGNPSLSTPDWAAAWNLEEAGFATSTSSGGGRGGYGVSDDDLDALTVGPGQAAWGEYRRPNTGGVGGRPLDYSTGRLYLGGGGGAGDGNTNVAGVGGNGGGLIYLIAPTIYGGGIIESNGTAGGFSYANNPFADGAGGGGAGGTIVLNSSGPVTNLTLTASGGSGGGTDNTVVKAYGPGGGGGAGYIGISSTALTSALTVSLTGGNGGLSSSPGMTEFPPNGATRGGTTTLASRDAQLVPLPVAWARFTAGWERTRTRLAWTTAQEKNNAYFVPERSLDGREFAACGEPVPGAGNSLTQRSYVAYDAKPLAKPTYYRIRQVDEDGTAHYSATVLVRPEVAAEAAAYPNPVRRGEVLRTGLPAGSPVLLTDVLGRAVAAPAVATEGGQGLDTRRLQPGHYWLRVPGGKAQRVVVQ